MTTAGNMMSVNNAAWVRSGNEEVVIMGKLLSAGEGLLA